jgi:O-antigen/teichoic acid export membrane protein
MVGLFVTADQFVEVALGPEWLELVPILRVFCWVGLQHSIDTTVGWIYLTQAQTALMFRWGLAAMAVKSVAFLIGAYWGALGVAVAYVVTVAVITYPAYTIPGRLVGIRFWDVVANLWRICLSALLMGAIVYIVRTQFAMDHMVVDFAVCILAGAVAFPTMLFIFDRRTFDDLIDLLPAKASVLARRVFGTRRMANSAPRTN